MAVNQTDKALNLASRLVAASSQLMGAVEQLAALKDEKESSGVDFTVATIQTALGISSIKHVDGAALNSILSSAAALKTWLEANFHDDNFQKARP